MGIEAQHGKAICVAGGWRHGCRGRMGLTVEPLAEGVHVGRERSALARKACVMVLGCLDLVGGYWPWQIEWRVGRVRGGALRLKSERLWIASGAVA